MNYLQRRNLDLLITWREKYLRCYTEPDPWPVMVRELFDRDLRGKRRAAREWLATHSARWRRKPPPFVFSAPAATRASLRWRKP